MSWSIGEIASLSIKATRGAGLAWGTAEEAGWALRCLARSGLPGAEALAARLQMTHGACPLGIGMAVCDSGDIEALERAGPIVSPLLVLPFLSSLAAPGRALKIGIGEHGAPVSAHVSAQGIVTAYRSCEPALMRVIGDHDQPVQGRPLTRIADIAPEALTDLTYFASKTYAPATEASRLSGAGAGLTDND